MIGPSVSSLAARFFGAMVPRSTRATTGSGSGMFVRFTTKQRRNAGWISALIYALCILAPTMSYALPGHHAVVDCMTIEGVAVGAMHMHSTGEPAHDHASAPAMDDGGDASTMSASLSDEQAPTKKSPHMSGQCCALMCLTVLPAPIVEVAAPSVPTLIRVATSYSEPADNAPVVHYRPPIAS